MIGTRVRLGSGILPLRSFTTRSSALLQKEQKGFKTPEEYVKQVKQDKRKHQNFKKSLLEAEFKYEPKVLSSENVEGKLVPLNVELLQYKPLRIEPTHGDEVATLQFKGHEEDDLIRAGEFALRAAFYLGIPMSTLKSLKTQKTLYTVIKAPFAMAKSKQNFHRTTYFKEVKAYDANPELIDLWLSYINRYKLENVEYNASIVAHESLTFHEELKKLDEFKLPEAYDDIQDPIAKKVKELLGSASFKRHL